MKIFDLLVRFYAFCFYRCDGCGKRLPKGQDTCNSECEELARDMQTFSF